MSQTYFSEEALTMHFPIPGRVGDKDVMMNDVVHSEGHEWVSTRCFWITGEGRFPVALML